ncbi:MAG: SDR family oxidoreductase [Solirubrobacterales bacterium]|nr:SDR family oxidoreductase [Solirubrobacterales bacterium]
MDFATAIVTGSDSGIGKATALALARRGLDIGITWHTDEAGALETARRVEALGPAVEVRRLDISDPEEAVAVTAALADALGGVDVFVNNAGTGHTTPALEVTVEEWRRVIDTDLVGAFLAAREAARRMVAAGHGGRIVNVTSVHEHVPLRGAIAYCAAKHGLGAVTKVLALELAEHGITVNSVAPGEIATAMTGNEDVDPHTLQRPAIPAGRPGDAREIAEAISHLASREASYTTGASLVIDGGMLLMAAVANQDASG